MTRRTREAGVRARRRSRFRRDDSVLRTKKQYLKEMSFYLSELVSMVSEVRDLKRAQLEGSYVPRSAELSPVEEWNREHCGCTTHRNERALRADIPADAGSHDGPCAICGGLWNPIDMAVSAHARCAPKTEFNPLGYESSESNDETVCPIPGCGKRYFGTAGKTTCGHTQLDLISRIIQLERSDDDERCPCCDPGDRPNHDTCECCATERHGFANHHSMCGGKYRWWFTGEPRSSGAHEFFRDDEERDAFWRIWRDSIEPLRRSLDASPSEAKGEAASSPTSPESDVKRPCPKCRGEPVSERHIARHGAIK